MSLSPNKLTSSRPQDGHDDKENFSSDCELFDEDYPVIKDRPPKIQKPIIRRSTYHVKDGQRMLDFILLKGWASWSHGNELWKHIEENNLLPELGKRSWSSLRSHWTRVVMKDLLVHPVPKIYRIKGTDLKYLLKVTEERKKRKGKCMPPPFLQGSELQARSLLLESVTMLKINSINCNPPVEIFF